MTHSPAIFASSFSPHVGGVEELVRQLAAEQRHRGMNPLVVTNRYPKSLPAHEVIEGQEVSRHAFRVPGAQWRHMAGWTAYGASAHLRVIRELKRRGTDLIHVQCVSSNASYALSASRALGLPLVVTLQGELTMDASQVYERSSFLRRLWRKSLDRAEVITACSRYVLEEAEAAYGHSFGNRGRVIPNGINLREYRQSQSVTESPSPFILGMGRMVEQKGFDVLIDAFKEISAAEPHLCLVLAGDGPVRPALEAQVATAGLVDRVTFAGRVAHDDAVRLLELAAAFVLPSRHEPQGIVVLEAMAAETPVVAAAVGGVPEVVIDGENGVLFPGGDVVGLVACMRRLLADRALRSAITRTGRLTAEHHDWGATTDAYLAAYAAAR